MKKALFTILALIITIAVFSYNKLSIYSVKPNILVPEGETLVVWKKSDEPFFTGLEAICIKDHSCVAKEMRVLGRYQERILLKLPYFELFNTLSLPKKEK